MFGLFSPSLVQVIENRMSLWWKTLLLDPWIIYLPPLLLKVSILDFFVISAEKAYNKQNRAYSHKQDK
jgi:hypothetical protein